MESDGHTTRRMILEAGQVVILHPDGPAGGFPMVVAVDQVARGEHWFLGSIDPIGRGETLIVELPVPYDARYATRAEVVASLYQALRDRDNSLAKIDSGAIATA